MSFRGNPNVVNLTDAQTITGQKTFEGNYNNVCLKIGQDDTYTDIVFLDNSNDRKSIIRVQDDGTTAIGAFLAPAVTAPASAITGSVVTTLANIKAATGHFKLGNGLIIQWGHWAGNGAGTITLPTPFTTTNYAPVFTDICENSNPTTAGIIKSVTSTNFKINIPTTMNGVYWVAIGY